MKIFYSFNRGLEKVENVMLSWTVIIMAALLIFNAVGRTMFGFSIAAITEITVYLMMILTFIGLSNAARKGKHIIMSAVLDLVPFKPRKFMMVLGDVVTIVFLAVMVYLTANYTVFVYETQRMLVAMNVPMWTLMIPMPIGCALGLYQYVLTLISNFKHKDKIFLGPEVEFLTEMEEANSVKDHLDAEAADNSKPDAKQ
ncbi:MAG: TRAP transporter small permease [Bacillota bacterium]